MVVAKYLNQTVDVKEYIGVSGSGKKIYNTTKAVPCRIEPETTRVVDDKGNDVVTSGRVFFGPETRFATGSQIVFDGAEYRLITLKPCYGRDEIYVEGWLK